jgi:hypothetical protein
MFLVQLLLPLYANDGERLPQALFGAVREELVERFGGLTAYARAPAKGLWKDGGDEVTHDDIVVYEVMADDLDRPWWAHYRAELGQRFRQDEVLVRAHAVERL